MNIKDKICLISGANSGIGKAAAVELAKRGAHIIMLCRNEEKAEKAKEDILRVCGHDKVDIVLADFSSLQQVSEAADQINATYPRIDVLNNNAGILMGDKRQLTEDGYEMTFQVNYLSHFLLTYKLIDKVFAAERGNIINVSSEAHRFASFDVNNLQSEKKYLGITAYANSKLLNVLFTHELAKRLQGTHVVTNALHPGGISTGLYEGVSGVFGFLAKLTTPFMPSEEKGARTTIHLATSEEGFTSNGQYFKSRKPATPSKAATNDYNARRLWEISEKMLNISFKPEERAMSSR
ncbi:MAG: SDR family oxidoreductase [Cyclobacteriaceae bacterium]